MRAAKLAVWHPEVENLRTLEQSTPKSEVKLDPIVADAEALYWAFQRRRADDPNLDFGTVPDSALIDIFEPHPRRTRRQR